MWNVTIQVEEKDVCFKLDTGAEVAIVEEKVLDSLNSKKLQTPTKRPPYMRKFSQYEIFAEQEANRIFAIIFSRITGSSCKSSMLCTVTNLQLLQTSKFSRIKFSLYQ